MTAKKIERFSMQNGNFSPRLAWDENGDLVKYSDYAALETQVSALTAELEAAKALVPAPNLRAVAVVEETHIDGDPFAARIRWLYNPVPEGAELYWSHPDAASTEPVAAGPKCAAKLSDTGCMLCANGNDVPDGEYCRACGYENNMYPLAAAVKRARGVNAPPRRPVAFDCTKPAAPAGGKCARCHPSCGSARAVCLCACHQPASEVKP
jgi:hypothetical protein